MKKHPVPTYVYIYTLDVIGILILVYALLQFVSYPSEVWLHFTVWLSLLCISRIRGLFGLISLKVSLGWATAIEFAVALVLPFSLFCLAIVISMLLIMTQRFRSGHSEPFLGPDFNAVNVIISGLLAVETFAYFDLLFHQFAWGSTASVLLAALVFAVNQVLLISILLALDERLNIRQVGSLKKNSLISELVFVTAGALLGRIYNLDPFLIAFLIIPLMYLQVILKKIDENDLIYIDDKTNLYNHRYFDECITKLFKEAFEKYTPLSVIFVDMDYLREVNNTYGHPVGDVAIKTVASIIKGNVDGNIAARFGGEEFVIILPGINSEGAAKLAEQVRLAIESEEIILENSQILKLTASLGVSSFPKLATTLDELVKTADNAVYEAKHAGRNQVKVYRPKYDLKKESKIN
jgi:diguanylate cyclase (GGDEF)-like protein